MKILLVIPRQSMTNEVDFQYAFPLGLAYISSAMKEAGHEVDCLNLNHFSGTVHELVTKKLDEKDYDILCSGHTGIGYAVIEKIILAGKEHPTRPKTIIGGPLITSEPELMLENLKPDYVVIAEGEKTIVELLEAIEKNRNLKNVDGIGFKRKVSFFTNPRKPIENLDSIPFPDFEGFDFGTYLDNLASEGFYGEFDYPRTYPLLASRGCPFQCTFCYHDSRYRQRSIDNVMNELEFSIPKWKINSVEIYDDMLSLDRKRLTDFATRMKELISKFDWKIKWTCQLSVINLDKEILQLLKESGCNIVSFGFESYSQEVLKSMRKPITPELIDKAINLCREVKMGIQGNFIFGDTAETKETAKVTLDYWKQNGKGQILLGFIQPYPGSEIYKRCIEKGIIKDKLDFIKNKMAHTNWFNMTENMTDEEVLQLKKDILAARREYAYYLLPDRVKKISDKKYNLYKKCPFCNTEQVYENCFIPNIWYFTKTKSCRNCNMRFFLVSGPYKFTVDNYQQVDWLRRAYLSIRDKFRKRRI